MIQMVEENEFFMVLNKPEGVSVHNQSPSLLEHLTKLKKVGYFVNRLDQETSGLVLVAKDPELHEPLAEALASGGKYYRALLRTPWKKTETNLTWKWAISDKAEGHKNPQGLSKDRAPALTKVEILRTNTYFTEAYIQLMTGRQHQIRKHAALAGHPIVGDPRYNEKKYNTMIQKHYPVKRMLLQAEKLEFTFEGKKYRFEKKLDLGSFFA